MAEKKKSARLDGWANIYTKQGVRGSDKQLANTFSAPVVLSEVTLDDTYRGDGFTRRIVDLPTRAMVRGWFDIRNDTDGDVNEYLSKLDLKKVTLRCLQWARVFGGAIMVMGINDGGTLEDELNEERIKDIEFFRAYDRYRVSWTTADLYTDPANPKYGQPRRYRVSPIAIGSSMSEFTVHESRVIIFDGLEVSDRARSENDGWGDSYIQHVWTQLSNMGGVFFAAKNVVDDFIQIIMKVENLAELIEAGQDDLIKARLELLDLGRHLINTMMIDAKEDFEKHANSVAGLGDLLDRFAMALSAVTGIPMTLLMGQSPKGLNATGDADIRFWYDSVREEQEATLLKPMNRIVTLAMKASMGPTKGRELAEWQIVFAPLWEPSEKETAETRKTVAETDKIYIDAGVLDETEVAISRFGGAEYSMETMIDAEERKKEAIIEAKEAVKEAKLMQEQIKAGEAAAKAGVPGVKAVAPAAKAGEDE